MKYNKLLISISLLIRQSFSLDCWGEYSCSILSLDKVIDNIPDINSAEECQNICNDLDGCKYFTFYDETSNVALRKTCHFFNDCDKMFGCKGCLTGPASCSATCSVPKTKKSDGGYWFCEGEHRSDGEEGEMVVTPIKVPSMAKCKYLCPGKPLQIGTCLSGEWDDGEMMSENSKKFSCQIQGKIETTWLFVILGFVTGGVVVSTIATMFVLFRKK